MAAFLYAGRFYGYALGSESGAVAGAVVIVDFFSVLVCVEVAHWDAYT